MFENKEYVYAVYTEKSFSKAAEKLYISQPCLSAMVKKVEEKLGVPLFYRNTRNIQLTEYGEKYIDSIEKIFKIEDDMEQYLNDIRGLKTGVISIGTNSVALSYILPRIIKLFSATYPEVKINIYEGNRIYLEEQMENGTIDLILDNYTLDSKSFETVTLLNERLFITIPKSLVKDNYSYFSAEDVISGKPIPENTKIPKLLKSSPQWIMIKKGNDSRKRFDMFCAKHHILTDRLIEVDQLISSWNMSIISSSMTISSDTMIKNMSNADSFVYLPLDSKIGERHLFLHYPKYKYISLPLKKFIEEMKSAI